MRALFIVAVLSFISTISQAQELLPYKRAAYTQAIAKTSSDGGRSYPSTITPVNRSYTDSQWQQSGGLEGVAGWKSDVFKYVPPGGEPRQTLIPVLNQYGYLQREYGWHRSYPDGTRFEDRLTNTQTGKVFERRLASKDKGVWSRRVIFADPAQRPAGYDGLKVTCSSCHDSFPGTGGYASGLVPGADTVFSDPFDELESGVGYASMAATEPIGEYFTPPVRGTGRARLLGRR